MTAPRHTTIRRHVRATLRRRRDPCALCGSEIDYTLKKPDPWSFEADHKIPRSRWTGDPALVDHIDNMQATHLRCNRVKGAGPVEPPETATHRAGWSADGLTYTHPSGLTNSRGAALWWNGDSIPPPPPL